MKTALTALALAALLPAGAVLAEDDDCKAHRDTWQPREAAMQLANASGWTVEDFEIDDGCYEIDGRDRDGREIEVTLDPATLKVVEMDYEAEDNRNARNPAPAGAVAPPANGLFEGGTPPQVKSN
ncbi:MAG: PepSY domain-containing protein [Bauldia sp.]|nr:PepSY domain-containing protein [Bauldia sp.]